jgi:DNA-binding NtrC family response regulator
MAAESRANVSDRRDSRRERAKHRDLEKRIADGSFREDLFYRLNVFPIRVPPLRERAEDIPALVWRFVSEYSAAYGKLIETIAAQNMAALGRYSWPGNIRELRNAVERAIILAPGPELTIPVPNATSRATTCSTKLPESRHPADFCTQNLLFGANARQRTRARRLRDPSSSPLTGRVT